MIHHDPLATPNDTPQPIIAPCNADSNKPSGHALDWICITSPNHHMAMDHTGIPSEVYFSRRSRMFIAEKDGKRLIFPSMTKAGLFFKTDAANLGAALRGKAKHKRKDGWTIYFKEADIDLP